VVGASTDSAGLTGSNAEAAAVGTGIGVGLIVGLWFFVDAFMAVVYGVYRLAGRT